MHGPNKIPIMPKSFSYISYRTTKSKLFQNLKPFGRREFSKYINTIIAEHRNISYTNAVPIKYLKSVEVVKLLEKIGEPLGDYGKTVEIPTRLIRYQLEAKIPYLSTHVFRKKIIKIIMRCRGLSFVEARNKKILHTNETLAFLLEIGEVYNVGIKNPE